MSPKADPRDWERHFRQGAPRRGGPLRALANLLLLGAALGLLGGGAFLALSNGLDRARQSAAATAQAVETSNAAVLATRTARALDASATSVASAVAAVATPTTLPEQLLGRGNVRNGGNLRNAPVVAPESVIGQICAGDQIDFLEQRTLDDGALWYRIRLTVAGEACSPQRVTVGSTGWANEFLLSPLGP